MALIPQWFSVLDRYFPGQAGMMGAPGNAYCDVYARVPDAAGVVAWTWVWEPLHDGPSPIVQSGRGPVAIGQVPTVLSEGWDGPSSWSPNNAAGIAIVNYTYAGVLYLYASVDGAALPGRLVMTVIPASEGDAYPAVSFSYQGGGPDPVDPFWIEHQNTYEIP